MVEMVKLFKSLHFSLFDTFIMVLEEPGSFLSFTQAFETLNFSYSQLDKPSCWDIKWNFSNTFFLLFLSYFNQTRGKGLNFLFIRISHEKSHGER